MSFCVVSIYKNPRIRPFTDIAYWKHCGWSSFRHHAKLFDTHESAEAFMNKRLKNGWARRHHINNDTRIEEV